MPVETLIAVHPDPEDRRDPDAGECDIDADEATCRRLCTDDLKLERQVLVQKAPTLSHPVTAGRHSNPAVGRTTGSIRVRVATAARASRYRVAPHPPKGSARFVQPLTIPERWEESSLVYRSWEWDQTPPHNATASDRPSAL